MPVRSRASRTGIAAAALEALLVKIIRTNRMMLGSDPRFFDIIAAASQNRWGAVDRFKASVTARLEEIVAAGIESGEYRQQDTTRAAAHLAAALQASTHPLLIRQLGPKNAARRAREQVRLLQRALA